MWVYLLLYLGYVNAVYDLTFIRYGGAAHDVGALRQSCALKTDCGVDFDGVVARQVSMLESTSNAIRTSAWIAFAVHVCAVVLLTVVLLAKRRPRAVRLLWVGQVAVLVGLVVWYLLLLQRGASALAGIAEDGRLVTFQVAFDKPFLDFDTLYFLGLFGVANGIAVLLTWFAARRLSQPAAPQGLPRGSTATI
jgi:hypothetical protein